jgi:Heparinase II/III-like protein/Heparinase II/III N-terminus
MSRRMAAVVASASTEALRAAPLGREFRELELPEAHVVGPWKVRRPTRKAMLGDRFYVYGLEARLVPPIDWLQNPHGSRSWRYELQTLTWLKEALARHAGGSDVEVLAVARDVVLDWTKAHLPSEGEQSEFAWYDMAVGLRAPYIAYVLRACLAEATIEDAEAELLLGAAERHGAELVDGRKYAAGSNHGLFQDEGLYLLARLLPELPAAAAWRELALTRLMTTLKKTVSFEDGAHLEHSPAYQLAITDLVARLAGNVSELGDLLDRIRRTVAWQVRPGGAIAQLGDTDDLPAPRWARDTAASLRGMNVLFEAGQAFVREGESYLAVSAAHHGAMHKHSDDAGFVLVEDGRVLLGDAGRWGYYEEEPDRFYARSAAAHNVLTVDGRDFPWRGIEPYGSGLEAAGEGDGWYAILVRNPLLAQQGVEHRRAFLYRPGEVLIVVDVIRSDDEHEYARHFHLGPELEAKRDRRNRRIRIAGEGIAPTLADLSGGAKLELVRGSEDPHVGWAYPGDRERMAVWTATLRSRAEDTTFVSALAVEGDSLDLSELTIEAGRVEIESSRGRSTVFLNGPGGAVPKIGHRWARSSATPRSR